MLADMNDFEVFPADAGVILSPTVPPVAGTGIPRGCGGDPDAEHLKATNDRYSPRMRG